MKRTALVDRLPFPSAYLLLAVLIAIAGCSLALAKPGDEGEKPESLPAESIPAETPKAAPSRELPWAKKKPKAEALPILRPPANVREIMLDQLEKGEYERAKQVVAWYLWAAKSYGIKAVNPGGVAAWKWGKDAKQLTSPIEGYSKLTPGSIVTQLAQICDDLGLPHPIHLHCNNLGAPGNISTTLDTLKHLEGRRAHIAHSQYHADGVDVDHRRRHLPVGVGEPRAGRQQFPRNRDHRIAVVDRSA